MSFLNWCVNNRISVAVYPPRSTRRLQPLGASLFSTLSTCYSQELGQFMVRCQGTSTAAKRSFISLFWLACLKAFTLDNIAPTWRETSLYPLEPEVVLRLITLSPTSSPTSNGSTNSSISTTDWRKMKALMKQVVLEMDDEKTRKQANKLQDIKLELTTNNSLL